MLLDITYKVYYCPGDLSLKVIIFIGSRNVKQWNSMGFCHCVIAKLATSL